MGFTEILTIAFVVLKLIGVITWSWWLVFMPEIIAVVLYAAFLLIVILVGIREEKKECEEFHSKLEDIWEDIKND